jgi:hypothetical protein
MPKSHSYTKITIPILAPGQQFLFAYQTIKRQITRGLANAFHFTGYRIT